MNTKTTGTILAAIAVTVSLGAVIYSNLPPHGDGDTPIVDNPVAAPTTSTQPHHAPYTSPEELPRVANTAVDTTNPDNVATAWAEMSGTIMPGHPDGSTPGGAELATDALNQPATNPDLARQPAPPWWENQAPPGNPVTLIVTDATIDPWGSHTIDTIATRTLTVTSTPWSNNTPLTPKTSTATLTLVKSPDGTWRVDQATITNR